MGGAALRFDGRRPADHRFGHHARVLAGEDDADDDGNHRTPYRELTEVIRTVAHATTTAAPATRTTPTPLPVHVRVRHGLRRPHNWVQLIKFVAVGGSGYLVNILTYAAFHEGLGVGHIRSATAAFVVAVFNNFWWNRHWTFGARGGHAGF